MAKEAIGDLGEDVLPVDFTVENYLTNTHFTHEIAFSSYAEAVLLLFCLGLAITAWLRSRGFSALYCSIGFALLIVKYVIGILLVEVFVDAGSSLLIEYPIIDYMRGCIGPIALIFLAIGMYQMIPSSSTIEQLE